MKITLIDRIDKPNTFNNRTHMELVSALNTLSPIDQTLEIKCDDDTDAKKTRSAVNRIARRGLKIKIKHCLSDLDRLYLLPK